LTIETDQIQYKPGACNIGPAEIRRRYWIGYTGLVLMAALILCVEWFHLPRIARLGLFIPAVYTFSGFVQAVKRFCFVYGWKSVASLSGRRKFNKITNENFQRQDRNTAISIVGMVLICSAILTTIYFFLPV